MTDKAIVRRGFLDLPCGASALQIRGRRSPASLPVHSPSIPALVADYVRLLPLLAGTVRAFGLDMPGYGASDAPPEEEWAVKAYAGFLFAVADKLGASRFHLFGRATGALVAASAARTRPERFLSLTLHGLPLYTAEEGRSLLAGYAPPYRLDEGGSHLAWNLGSDQARVSLDGCCHGDADRRGFLAAGPDFAASYRAMWRYDVRKLNGGWTVSTLLIHGGRDRIAEMRPRAQALLPDAQEVFFDQATNFIAEQEPERFAACLLPFLEAHTPS